MAQLKAVQDMKFVLSIQISHSEQSAHLRFGLEAVAMKDQHLIPLQQRVKHLPFALCWLG